MIGISIEKAATIVEKPLSAESKNPLIVLEPPEELEFKDRFGHVTGVPLIVKNKNDREIYFKIKSTASKFYSVRPSYGKIHPHGQIKVIIQPHDDSDGSLDVIEEKRHRFMVQAAFVDSSKPMEAETFWKKAENTELTITNARLRSKVVRFKQTPVAKDVDNNKQNGDNNQRNWDKLVRFQQTPTSMAEDGDSDKQDTEGNHQNKDNNHQDVENKTQNLDNNQYDVKNKQQDADNVQQNENNNHQNVDNKHQDLNNKLQNEDINYQDENNNHQHGDNNHQDLDDKQQHGDNYTKQKIDFHRCSIESVNDAYGCYIGKVLDGLPRKNSIALKKEIAELIAKYEQFDIDD